MKKNFLYVLILSIVSSCKQQISKNDLPNLNGYWEIEKVVLENGSNKDYTINETIDFFEVKNNSGFRKKVTPQFNGKYLINDVSEKIKIISENDNYFIHYKTNYSTWKEEIVELSKDKLILKNDSNVTYNYKKSIPFSVK